jgi:hypothetical protein
MPTVTLAQATSFQVLDTANTANTGVLRDSSGNIAAAQVSGSEIKSTGTVTITRVAKTAAFTADTSARLFSCDATTAAFAATLPPAATVPGRVYTFRKTDASANAVTVTANGAETIDGTNTKVLSTQYAKTTIVSNGTSWEVIA